MKIPQIRFIDQFMYNNKIIVFKQPLKIRIKYAFDSMMLRAFDYSGYVSVYEYEYLPLIDSIYSDLSYSYETFALHEDDSTLTFRALMFKRMFLNNTYIKEKK